VDVGDVVTALYEGQSSRGRVEAVNGGRALVRLTVRAVTDWTSPLTGGTVPAGCPRTYLLWLPWDQLRGTLGAQEGDYQRQTTVTSEGDNRRSERVRDA